ncbi:MAG: hypothetical protein Ct9H300mP1_12300 [Planctomycetaceae bacterium]|nr:MAG: hypothetical protein Ct9H300mP1_12300 [Planctomycetaceae bacterium]
MSAAVTRARALGATSVALPSAGNAAGAAPTTPPLPEWTVCCSSPRTLPRANIIESAVGGARVHLVNGLIGDCGKMVGTAASVRLVRSLDAQGALPDRGEKDHGLRTGIRHGRRLGVNELQLPDVIFYPTGGGTGLIGMWKAFDEMEQLGWIGSERPRMVVVQAEHCAPVVGPSRRGPIG